jgi:hypothetical protein
METKQWYKSKTVWTGIAGAALWGAQAAGISVPAEIVTALPVDLTAVPEILTETPDGGFTIDTFIGIAISLLTIWSRIRADKRIG